jgi:acyl-CoA synthetase (AMP-forming)/AMP-acid ligase II
LLRIAGQLGDPFLYTDNRLRERLRHFAEQHELQAAYARLERRAFVTDDLVDIGRAGRVHAVRSEDVAFIQYSSGSTSAPKGVVLTHANLLANLRGSTAAAGFNEQDVSLSWMPLTHDMGLIGFHIIQTPIAPPCADGDRAVRARVLAVAAAGRAHRCDPVLA